MKEFSLPSILLILFTVLSSATIALGQITVTGEVSEMPASMFVAGPPAESASDLLVPQAAFETFGVDYSMEGATELKIVWKAPAGQLFQIAAPAGFADVEVEFLYELDATPAAANAFDPSSIGFRNHTGGSPGNATMRSRFSTGASPELRVSATMPFVPREVTTFESFEISISINDTFDFDYQDINVLNFGIFGTATASGINAPTAPQNWITLIPAPESLSAVLARKAALDRMAKKIKRQLKKAKRKGDQKKVRKSKKKLRRVNRSNSAIQIPEQPQSFLPVDQQFS